MRCQNSGSPGRFRKLTLTLPFPGIDLYLKDESTHPTGSLKHRLARSLFLYGICNGWITQGTPVIEASSGSTAVSEAYFAQLLDLPFIAVMPASTSPEKRRWIEHYNGSCHMVDDPATIYDESRRLADEKGGHFMEQFTYAERATDWRGNNNIAHSIFAQMEEEPHPVPRWVVTAAGTGGTSATLGRFFRYQQLDTKLCVVDPDNSVFFDYYKTGDGSLTCSGSSGVEGIGRPRVEPSFIRQIVDRMIKVPNEASFAALYYLYDILGRRCGGSTGTLLCGAISLMAEMAAKGEQGSVVMLICDGGDRYMKTYYDPQWLKHEGYDIAPWQARFKSLDQRGAWSMEGMEQAAL